MCPISRTRDHLFFRCRSSYVLRRSLPMFPVFSNLSDLNQKKVKKERQNKEVKRTKTKSLEAQTSVTKKKKSLFPPRRPWCNGSIPYIPLGGPGSTPGGCNFFLKCTVNAFRSLSVSFTSAW